MRGISLIAIACTLASPAWAMREPDPGKIEPRMVTAAYNPAEVYRVHVPQGQTLAVNVAPDEVATDGFGGDKKSIVADISGNVVMLWSGDAPVAPRTVFIRSRRPDLSYRTYSLLVDTAPPAQAQISFTFVYPGDEAAHKAAASRGMVAEREQKATKAALDAAQGAADSNTHYVLQGEKPEDWNLLPTRHVTDNGTDTHFFFPGNMRIPVIYALNPDGKPAVVEPTFNSKTGIATVHQLAKVFHLRDGDAMLCVFNRTYDPVGKRSATGTVSDDVVRVTK